MTDKQRILLSVIVRKDFNQGDKGKSLREIINSENPMDKNSLYTVLYDFFKKNDSYNDISSVITIQRIEQELGSLLDLRLENYEISNGQNQSGLAAIILENETDRYFIFRGTEDFTDSLPKILGLGSIDEADNFISALTDDSNQIREAYNFVNRNSDNRKNNHLVGFSKGANLALAVALKAYNNIGPKIDSVKVINPFSIDFNNLDAQTIIFFANICDIIVLNGDIVSLIRSMDKLEKEMINVGRQDNFRIVRSINSIVGHSIEETIFDNGKTITLNKHSFEVLKAKRKFLHRLILRLQNVIDNLKKNPKKLKKVVKRYMEFSDYHYYANLQRELIDRGYDRKSLGKIPVEDLQELHTRMVYMQQNLNEM